LIGAYNSLTDKHLTAYFNNARIRRHLQRVGLISRSGRIVSEKEFRYKIILRDQQRHVRECLAQAIFHRVLDMERLHQTEIRRKLEDFSRREQVNKVKVERCNRYEDDQIIILTPRPPTRLRSSQAQHSEPEREASDSTDSFGSSRPNTAPEKTQRPVRLKPLNSTSTLTSTKKNLSHSHNHASRNNREQPISYMLDRNVMRHLTLRDFSNSASPYRLPVINNLVTPVPPLKKKDNVQNGTLWGRRLRPTTAPSDAPEKKEGAVQRVCSQTAVVVKMVYFGKSVRLAHELNELKDEVKVFQQHCGGENLCVYKGRLKEGELFQFMSRRHRGFPFSLTFYLNGLQVERLSSCCEFKHRKNLRLGGRSSHFGFSGVEGAAPCYRCIIAMGLDKKPTPPKRIRNDPLTSKSCGKEEEEKHLQSESSQSHETETKKNTNQEHKHKNGYEEDFEADDEGPIDDGVYEGIETSPLLSREEEDGRRKDENGTDDLKFDMTGSSSVSSGLSSSSSSSEVDEDEVVINKAQKEEVKVTFQRRTVTLNLEKHAEETKILQTSSMSLPNKEETQNQEGQTEKEDGGDENPREEPQETGEPRAKAGEAEEPIEELQEAEKPIEKLQEAEKPIEKLQEAEEPIKKLIEAKEPRDELIEGEKVREDLREGTAGNVNKLEEQAKSVQEKLAEAILSMTECVSEPELSDSTTEEDEMMWVRSMKNGPGSEPDSNVAQQPADEENEAEPLQDAEREFAHMEEPKEELENETNETPQPEAKTEEEENHNKQIEVKTENKNSNNEKLQDENNDDEEKDKDTKSEVTQNIIDNEGQTHEVTNLTNKNNKSNEEPELMEMPEFDEPPSGEISKSEESFGQKLEKEATSETSVNAEETMTTPVEEEFPMVEENTELQTENPEETSMNYDNVDQNSKMENVTDEEWSAGEEVSKDNATEGHQAEKGETFDKESRNLNNGEETENYVTTCDVKDTELKLNVSSVSEVNDEDVAGEEEELDERVGVPEIDGVSKQGEDGDGVKTNIRNKMEEENENKKEETKDQELTEEERAYQKTPPTSGHTSKEKVGERKEQEKELTAEEDVELKHEEVAGIEGKEKINDIHEKEVKETEFFHENEVEDIAEKGEEITIVAGADAEMQKTMMEQENVNYKEQKEISNLTVHEVVQKTTDEDEPPEEKSVEIETENREEIITLDQEGLKEVVGLGETEGTPETNEEKINQGVTEEEGVKEEQMNFDNEIEEEKKRETQLEKTTAEEVEEEEVQQKVGEEQNDKKHDEQQKASEEVKDEQKAAVENNTPLISGDIINVATQYKASSDPKSPGKDFADVELKHKNMSGEEEIRAIDGNNIPSSIYIKKDKSVENAGETRSVEESTCPSEESQPLEKLLALRREEREAELIVAPQTNQGELVSSWVNFHQASNYFETFVEPLDGIKIRDEEKAENAEVMEMNQESSETEMDKLSIKHEKLEDKMVENFNRKTKALLGGQRSKLSIF
ncbi:glutamate-rich protein 3, partial [Silurus asotus]